MRIKDREVGIGNPVYFIADIASNHDGEYERAERLIHLAAEAGADAVKFQNWKTDTLISDHGFRELGSHSHQASWDDSVYSYYKKYELPLAWTANLMDVCNTAGVDFLTTPYDLDIVRAVSPFVCAWKLGSGDITWEPMVKALAASDKPLIIATGASTNEDIARALSWANFKQDIALLQCTTDYTNNPDNLKYVNLKVLVNWWGGGVFGLSDHTQGHSTVLGAVALGASIIEKHFTDDNSRAGPDHAFSMNPVTWAAMITRTRELESALGDGRKKVEDNETETRILQRRAVRTLRTLKAGEKIQEADLVCLRPCPQDALPPYRIEEAYNQVLKREVAAGDYIRADELPKMHPSLILAK